jgi:N-acetylglucosamine-6-phosphate deacetylase
MARGNGEAPGAGCNNACMRTLWTAEKLWDGERLVERPLVEVEDGRIASIESRLGREAPEGIETHDLGGAVIGPSFFDVHIHGAAGHDAMEGTEEALGAMGRFLASRGTANYFPTTVTAPVDDTLRALELIARRIQKPAREGEAQPIGIHMEGPFLSHVKRGVHPENLLLKPDIAVFDLFYEAGEGQVRLLTLAPELEGAAELAAHAVSRGVRVSLGHSNATAAETRAAIAAGATSATHTFNAMRPLDHREPGILGVTLTTDALFAELICDGIHTAPEMAKLWWRAKGGERGILITDGISATGMPDGTYQLGGITVQVADGRAMANGVLAGSVLTLDRALENFVRFTGATVEQGLRLLTANPAAMTGCEDRAGALRVGGPANFVAVHAAGKLVASVVGGQLAQ